MSPSAIKIHMICQHLLGFCLTWNFMRPLSTGVDYQHATTARLSIVDLDGYFWREGTLRQGDPMSQLHFVYLRSLEVNPHSRDFMHQFTVRVSHSRLIFQYTRYSHFWVIRLLASSDHNQNFFFFLLHMIPLSAKDCLSTELALLWPNHTIFLYNNRQLIVQSKRFTFSIDAWTGSKQPLI